MIKRLNMGFSLLRALFFRVPNNGNARNNKPPAMRAETQTVDSEDLFICSTFYHNRPHQSLTSLKSSVTQFFRLTIICVDTHYDRTDQSGRTTGSPHAVGRADQRVPEPSGWDEGIHSITLQEATTIIASKESCRCAWISFRDYTAVLCGTPAAASCQIGIHS